MKKEVLLWLMLSPLLLFAQTSSPGKGIKWVQGLSWRLIMEKAKAERKYIFLDCFATWCGPCHAMDKDVYPDEKVGEAINERFIAVKVQMDKTAYDNDTIKIWYRDASAIEKNYAINAFPTFLFFSPDGQPLHRAVGYRKPTEFVTLVADALNPEKQYYALLKNYKPGKLDTSELKGLARALRNSGGDLAARLAIEYLSRIQPSELSSEDNLMLMCEFGNSPAIQQIVSKYLSSIPAKKYSDKMNWNLIRTFSQVPSISNPVLKYLGELKTDELSKQLTLLTVFKTDPAAKIIANKYVNSLKKGKIFTKENLSFLQEFTNCSKDIGFKIFRENSARIDKVMNFKDFANIIIGNVIIEEEYDPSYKAAIKSATDNVHWQTIEKTVKDNYGSAMAERLDLQVRSSLYKNLAEKTNRYWPEYIKYNIAKLQNGYDTTHPQIQFIDVMQINNFVFGAIFYHSNDTQQMKTGLRLMEGVLRRNPKEANNMDTYANLLYKLGKKEEAIQWEEKALQLAVGHMDWVIPSLQANLEKMKNGEPTWIVPDDKRD